MNTTIYPCGRRVQKDRGYSTPMYPRVYFEPCGRPAVLVLVDDRDNIYDRSCARPRHSASLRELAAEGIGLHIHDLREEQE